MALNNISESSEASHEQLLASILQKEKTRAMAGRFLESQIAHDGPLNNEINEIQDLWGYSDGVVVGNTGVFFINDNGIVFKHFLPDGSSISEEGSRDRFKDSFYAGYAAFLDWYSQPQNRSFGGSSEIKTIYGVTNHRMRQFQDKLFGRHIEVIGHYHSMHGDEDITALNIDALIQDQAMLDNIKQLGEKALKAGWRMGSIPMQNPVNTSQPQT